MTNIEDSEDNVNGKRNTIIRVVHNRENPFVQLNRNAIWDKNLSMKAVGLWAKCLSRPNNWKFSIQELARSCKEGRRAIDTAMKELIQYGYAMRLEYFEKDECGKFKKDTCGMEYVFFEFAATEEEKQEQLDIFKKSFLRCGFGNSRNGNSRNSTLLIKSLKKSDVYVKDIPPICPPKEETEIEDKSSEAGARPFRKSHKEFSQEVKDVSKKMLDILSKYTTVYRPPKDMCKFHEAVRKMVEDEQQNINTIIETFEWSIRDNEKRGDFNGWQGIIATNNKGSKTTNPAEMFHKYFSKLNAQMSSRKKRTFAQCSDDNKAYEAMKKMDETAL